MCKQYHQNKQGYQSQQVSIQEAFFRSCQKHSVVLALMHSQDKQLLM